MLFSPTRDKVKNNKKSFLNSVAMGERICSNCDGGAMKYETGDIQREIKVSFVKLSVEEYLPEILKGYGQYTLYVCEKCGKLEVFLKKARMVAGKKKKRQRNSDTPLPELLRKRV